MGLLEGRQKTGVNGAKRLGRIVRFGVVFCRSTHDIVEFDRLGVECVVVVFVSTRCKSYCRERITLAKIALLRFSIPKKTLGLAYRFFLDF